MDNSNAAFRRQSRRLFAVLRAIIRRSAYSSSSKRDFAARLEGRVGALGRVQEMIMRAPGEGVDLEELVHGELLAQAIPAARYRLSGPETRIGSEAAVPLALALHELAVNSVIHGSFADSQGALKVTWEHIARDGREWLQLVWRETEVGNAAHPPSANGFGLELLERTLPYELDACTRVELSPAGARIELQIPAGPPLSSWTRGERTVQP